ncbi:MAG: methyl-accepting chemotaxis protein [Ghiorsea sp.]|nr:methyl-accepting chemotaxis protein [Ghiorsea sp.]
MRKNLPITNHEVMMKDGQVLISETNLKGIITDVNDEFVEISGFTKAELIGKNHNVVRHPEMPPEAFQDLWDTVRAGKPWTGLVKNRCKDGGFYWVQANVAPIFNDGNITGYVSVRSTPDRQSIEQASALYAKINAGKASLKDESLLQKLNIFKRMQVWQKIAATLAIVIMLLGGSWFMTLQGLTEAHDGLLMSGNDRQVALSAAAIERDVLSIMIDLKKTQTLLDEQSFKDSHVFLIKALAEIDQDIKVIQQADLGEEEVSASQAFLKATQHYIDAILMKVDEALLEEDYATFNDIVIALNNQAFQEMEHLGRQFHDVQAAVSLEEAESAEQAYNDIFKQSIISVIFSLFIAGIGSTMLIRTFRRRARYTSEKLAQIAEGNYFDWIELDVEDEVGEIQSGLKSLQIIQGYAVLKVQEEAESALRIKVALDQVSSNVMIADANREIFYMNNAMESFMQKAESEFAKLIPDFKADALLGSCIDQFHANPAHQQDILAGLTSSYESDDIKIGDYTVRVTATPVRNESDERIATVAEWVDRTAEINVEHEIESVFSAVQRGDFTQEVSTTGKVGFFLQLSGMINDLNKILAQGFGDVHHAVNALNDGVLTYRIENEYEGTFDDIKQAMNQTMEKLTDVIGDVQASAEEVGLGAGEISEGNNTLNSRTQEQAAALEETAASIEEITGTVQQTADNSRQANQLALDTRDQAETGGKVADEAVKAMAEINASSRKISDIIGVIDEIAFQTNLLALNAAVEAARAGEQGRGFAVVAGEVRTLAQRSAEAAKEIKTLINSSVESVENGSRLVDQSGTALNDIRSSVGKVSDIIAEIAAASVEQSAGIDQINKAIAQLDAGTQQNTAMVEESAAASQRLNDQAAELRNVISIFQLD